MSAPRDDEPVSIDADAPEADWIEQHQPVIDESDEDLFPPGGPEEVTEAEGDIVVDDEPSHPAPTQFGETSRQEPDQLVPSSARTGSRGCNLIGVVAHALVRGGRNAARELARRNTRFSR